MTSTVRSSDQTTPIAGRRFWVALLLIAFVMPFFFYAGSLRLSPYRIILIVLFVPTLFFWISGRAGRVKGVDFLVLLIGVWPPIALLANHGFAATWEFSGMYMIEAMTPYFIARTMIRDLPTYRFFVLTLFLIIFALLPFAIYENVSGRAILLEMFDKVFDVYRTTDKDLRLGLRRAQASMPHPILFGLFCSPTFALALYTLRSRNGRRSKWRYPTISLAAVFTSLSSGAFMSIAAQMALISWDVIFRNVKQRWKFFLILAGIIYLALELGSNRPVYEIAATKLTFDAGNSWNRVLIFRHSTDDIANNPIFGLGFRDWTRPAWMKPSVDNFWLLQALSYGFPALFAYAGTLLVLFVQVGRAPLSGARAQARIGHLIAITGVSVAVITVHMWDAIFSLYMFLLGAGVWFIDAADGEEELSTAPQADRSIRRSIQYTRFPALAAQSQVAGPASEPDWK